MPKSGKCQREGQTGRRTCHGFSDKKCKSHLLKNIDKIMMWAEKSSFFSIKVIKQSKFDEEVGGGSNFSGNFFPMKGNYLRRLRRKFEWDRFHLLIRLDPLKIYGTRYLTTHFLLHYFFSHSKQFSLFLDFGVLTVVFYPIFWAFHQFQVIFIKNLTIFSSLGNMFFWKVQIIQFSLMFYQLFETLFQKFSWKFYETSLNNFHDNWSNIFFSISFIFHILSIWYRC